jgi:hypothetical protein
MPAPGFGDAAEGMPKAWGDWPITLDAMSRHIDIIRELRIPDVIRGRAFFMMISLVYGLQRPSL